jgi:hypothetical protein
MMCEPLLQSSSFRVPLVQIDFLRLYRHSIHPTVTSSLIHSGVPRSACLLDLHRINNSCYIAAYSCSTKLCATIFVVFAILAGPTQKYMTCQHSWPSAYRTLCAMHASFGPCI